VYLPDHEQRAGTLSERRDEAIVALREDMFAEISNHMHTRGSMLSLKAISPTSESSGNIVDPFPG
jgi:hypothetical protein